MTKEEALQDEYNKWVDSKGIRSIYPTGFPEAYKEAALNAVTSYAKQQAIAFDTWKRNNKWSDAMDEGVYIKPIGTHGSIGFKFEKASFEYLYGQFIEQQNKDNESNPRSKL